MTSNATSPEEYIESLPENRKQPVSELRNIILKNLPSGFQEIMSYGMLGYVVPHAIYPPGYHCDPKLPLAFANLASQKTLFHFTIWVFTQCLNCLNGLLKSIQNTLLLK